MRPKTNRQSKALELYAMNKPYRHVSRVKKKLKRQFFKIIRQEARQKCQATEIEEQRIQKLQQDGESL